MTSWLLSCTTKPLKNGAYSERKEFASQEQILSLKSRLPFGWKKKIKVAELLPLEGYPFTFIPLYLKANLIQSSGIFSSPELKARGGAFSIGRLRRPERRRHPLTISNNFSSESTWAVVTKFHM